MNKIPHAIADIAVFLDSTELLGIVNVTLPDLEWMEAELSGGGLMGEASIAIAGMLKSMSTTFEWRQVTAESAQLAAPKGRVLDLRAAAQSVDGSDSSLKIGKFACMMTVIPKKDTQGKAAMGELMGNSTEFEVLAYELTIDGTAVYKINKMNYVCEIKGTDYAADIKSALGK